ncbi:hypothetical protein FF098_014955 [Parvularcula flava]|uniref:Uncharacterized protein n=1 Tax=Aquisalinus luteolus TaxID=1566827 RepID=A0A8J3ES52_9PROT|nr:hypothetical protein [Aquisalinus luteolus]NHK29217.1 hypothetical protein [Aquisalinus luteolus]GGH99933.1 hypothetical protein GCM10011355_27040 [Aquisalinus luteolus]
MFDLEKIISESVSIGVKQGVAKAFKSPEVKQMLHEKIDEAFLELAHKNRRLGDQDLCQHVFGNMLAFELMRHGYTVRESFKSARQTVTEFLKDSGIEYGDAGYGWSQADAENLAHEYFLRAA